MAAVLICALLLLFPKTSAPAAIAHPDSMRVIRMTPEDAFSIPETGALVVKEGANLTIQFAPPAANRPAKYRSVDLQEGDLILLVNGKRVKTIEDLKKAHAAAPVGGEIKFGIQRGQEMMIVAFEKADPKDLPKMNMRIVTSSGGDGTEVLPAVGVVLAEKKNGVVVEKLLPVETAAVKGLNVDEGDAIVALNGAAVTSLKEFVRLYDAIAVGEKVEWKTRRSGKDIAVSFAKPKPMGRVIMRREPR